MIYAIIALVLLVALLVGLYNRLARQRVVVDEASSDIETFLKQRYDMIPNLVEIVKGYATYEKETFREITEMRAKAMSASSLSEKMEIEADLTKALSKIMAVAENYPELKANTNFLELQNSLNELEDNIQKSRRFYNGAARDFNTTIAVFPNNLLAGVFGFTQVPFFQAGEEEKENVKIKF